MIKCNNCNSILILNKTENSIGKIGIKKDDFYLCIECNDVLDFFEDKPKKKIESSKKIIEKSIKKPVEKSKEVFFYCIKCKKSFSGLKCDDCGFENPLMKRKPKKKKKKKK